MKQSIHALTLQKAAQAAGLRDYRRETEHRLESDIGEDERNAAREWLRHVEAGRVGGGQ